ncbi:capsular biosynthesis protein [Neiella marina]|uniref:Capsular biosynthesis protein n=1 Tax=Neiella holothuriorum TaxID=2870530 RepID=A0ABS7EG20_9GAMM|nr:capsular biosynthesis protein [Neiella holothuriorum]MBW8190751.1 capsular biosynthesis protein [Neiella holothuriorum]
MDKLIVDLDSTITLGDSSDYESVSPNSELISKLREYKSSGFYICIFTARNMRTYDGNVGKINVNTLPIILEWLKVHNVPYDEVIVGKPWCGHNGFYIDDKAIRPSEFASMSHEKIKNLLAIENSQDDGSNK